MASIVDPRSDSKPQYPPTTVGVGRMMQESAEPMTREAGALIEYIGSHHEHPVTCGECRDGEYLPCAMLENANSVAIAWLMGLVRDRG